MNDPNSDKILLCGAKNRQGQPCRRAPMPNGRCHLHGGKSTGPRTAAGIERMRAAKMIHGLYSRKSQEQAREMRDLIRQCQELRQRLKD